MDILIKNMELPKEGGLVLYVRQDGTVIIPYYFTVRLQTPMEKTTAVALPEHGDLIDRDTIIKDSWASYMLKKKHDDSSRAQYDTLMGYEIRRLLEDAPTIVEASNE